MEVKKLKTSQDIIEHLNWYEQKLNALDSQNLAINLVENKNSVLTIEATVENESFYGVLAVEFVDNIKKQLRREIKSLQKQLAARSARKSARSRALTRFSFGAT